MKEADELLQKAHRSLAATRHLLEGGFHGESASRSYYAMFYAAEAALLSEGITASTHSGVHRMFGKHFIKTGVLPAQLSTHLGQVFKARQSADYGNAQTVRENAAEAMQKAASFVEHVEAYLREPS